jgi:hypothetical protein
MLEKKMTWHTYFSCNNSFFKKIISFIQISCKVWLYCTNMYINSHSNLQRRHKYQINQNSISTFGNKTCGRTETAISWCRDYCLLWNDSIQPNRKVLLHFISWTQRQYWYISTRLQCIQSQKTEIFIFTTHYKNIKSHIHRICLFNELWGKNSKHISIRQLAGLQMTMMVCLTSLFESAKKLSTKARWVILGATWTCHSCMLEHTWQQYDKLHHLHSAEFLKQTPSWHTVP